MIPLINIGNCTDRVPGGAQTTFRIREQAMAEMHYEINIGGEAIHYDIESSAVAKSDTFRIGDVIEDDAGRFWVCDEKMGVTGTPFAGSLCRLRYRAIDQALAGLAGADRAFVYSKEAAGEFMQWLGTFGDGEHVMSWDGVTRGDMGERGWLEAMTNGTASPDSAKRWLEERAEERRLDEAAAKAGMVRKPSDSSGLSAFRETETVELTAHCGRCGDTLNERHDPTKVVDGRALHRSCAGELERLKALEREERPMLRGGVDPYAGDKDKRGASTMTGITPHQEKANAAMRAENLALFGHVPKRFTADTVPTAREEVGHPWECQEDEP